MHSPSVLLHGLGDFVKFLVGLIADPNFKIAISSMSILGDLAGKVGNELEAHLRCAGVGEVAGRQRQSVCDAVAAWAMGMAPKHLRSKKVKQLI